MRESLQNICADFIRNRDIVKGQFRMENSCSPQPTKKRKRIPTLERGLGFQILRHMAEKYQGDFQCGADGSNFVTSVMIKGEL